ncbi:hypothetical protein PR003_g3158 [Phytophthora rubi]|uniref:Uncharacterized protein n=1 Tax=Phytophthora rubi TaxID=129364 RepID=A0A6A3NEY5_9STRA|nr:hypothetical protein PR002_g3035 [Phytophthora rubi]KAE9354826.1 hypothetical protein PR003_g3158 [Phytophthora rubi]
MSMCCIFVVSCLETLNLDKLQLFVDMGRLDDSNKSSSWTRASSRTRA